MRVCVCVVCVCGLCVCACGVCVVWCVCGVCVVCMCVVCGVWGVGGRGLKTSKRGCCAREKYIWHLHTVLHELFFFVVRLNSSQPLAAQNG